MEIGTIGAGAFAQAFAKRALKAGHKVKLSNSRGPDSLLDIVDRLGPGGLDRHLQPSADLILVRRSGSAKLQRNEPRLDL